MFKVYKASAGAGKTTHLVIEYLTLCFREPRNFRHILAITFTNNSTAEMKVRIVNMLYKFAFTPVSDLSGSERLTFNEIQSATKLSDEQMVSTANDLLKNILYDYDNFSISTIDSFFQRILRSFAFELGLNMNFNVQVSLEEFYEQTVDTLLNRISADDPELSARVLSLVNEKMSVSGKWNVGKELRGFMSNIYKEESYFPMQRLASVGVDRLNACFDNLKEERIVVAGKIIELADKGNSLIDGLIPDEFVGKTQGVYGFFTKIKKAVEKVPFEMPGYKSVKDHKDNFFKDSCPPLHNDLLSCVEGIEESVKRLTSIDAVLQTSGKLVLLVDLKSIMDEIKLRDNLFYLGETNTRLLSEIKDDDAPYIYEKLGNKYAFFFIDEFQDTSMFQWENMMPLVRTALSQTVPFKKGGGDETGSTILFGDVKQAIYRFRGGEAELLNSLSNINGASNMLYPGAPAIRENDFDVTLLDSNYRSSTSVISFNNSFFDYIKTHDTKPEFELAPVYYSDVEQKIPEKKKGKDGFVTARFFEDDFDEQMCLQVLDCVNDALVRGYSYKDIAVLVRSNAKASDIACTLQSAMPPIPVISKESLLVKASDNVMLIIAALKYVVSSSDNLAKFSILYFLFKNTRLENIDWGNLLLKKGNESPFAEAKFKQLLASAGVDFDREKAGNYPLYTIIMKICSAFGLNGGDVFVTSFLDFARAQMPSGDMRISEFLELWDLKSKKLSVKSTQGVNAVTVNTIHSAKGLEYPVLIFPITRPEDKTTKDYIWVEQNLPDTSDGNLELPVLVKTKKTKNTDELLSDFTADFIKETNLTDLDLLNIIYVSLTRASECMYLLAGNIGTKKDDNATDSKSAKKTVKCNNIAKLLYDFVQSGTLDIKKDETAAERYWFGNKHFKPSLSADGTADSDLEDDNLRALSTLDISDFTTDKLIMNVVKKTEEQETGIYVHDFLASLKRFPQNEPEAAEVADSADPKYRERVLKALINILGDESLKPYFAPDVHCINEIPIASQPTLSGQSIHIPDRIVFLDGEVKVIDYKTGHDNEEYEKQLTTYCSLLEQMGYENVSYRILFI